jgi:glycosyltransferase involved in cell wall biosynthesis
VSVVVPTFQHAPYVRQAVESVLAQRTSFPVQILIGEDGSTDGTQEICEELRRSHPDRVRVLSHGHLEKLVLNGRQVGRVNLVETLRQCTGRYIALLDGDDFWTDPQKLQKQVDFMEANRAYSFCFHRVDCVTKDGGALAAFPRTRRVEFPTEQVLLGDVAKTPSMLFRATAIPRPLPEWYRKESPIGDWPLTVLAALSGPARRLPGHMASYRFGVGIFSTRHECDRVRDTVELRRLLLRNLPERWHPTLRRGLALMQLLYIRLLVADGRRDEAGVVWSEVDLLSLSPRSRSDWRELVATGAALRVTSRRLARLLGAQRGSTAERYGMRPTHAP